MKMLYPRKIDDVLWHSATWRFSKSILVKIPRLPTMRVMGSQFISTNLREEVGVPFSEDVMVAIISAPFICLLVRSGPVSGGEFGARLPPLRFFVDGFVGECAQRADHLSVGANAHARDFRPRRFVHEGHEFVRESRH